MNIIFALSVLFGLILIFVRKRRFDAFSIAFIGAVIYLSPGFFGVTKYHVLGRWITTDIADTAYYLMISFMLWIAISAYIYDKIYTNKIIRIDYSNNRTTYGTEKYQLMFLLALSIVGILYQILASPDFLTSDKSQMMSSLGRGHIVFEFCAIYGFCYSIALKQNIWAALFFIFLLFDTYIGFRFGLGVGLGAAICLGLLQKKPESFIFRNKAKIFIAISVLSILFIYKQLAWGVKAGEWGMLIDMVSNGDVFIRAFDEMEPFVVANNLNQIVLSNYYYPPSDFFISVLRGIVPIGYLIGGGGGFDFQYALFSDVDYGLSGSMIGEVWAALGIYGFPFYLIFYSSVLIILNKIIFSKHINAFVLSSILIIIFGIYFHRNTFEFQFLIMRRIVLIHLILSALHHILLMANTRKNGYTR